MQPQPSRNTFYSNFTRLIHLTMAHISPKIGEMFKGGKQLHTIIPFLLFFFFLGTGKVLGQNADDESLKHRGILNLDLEQSDRLMQNRLERLVDLNQTIQIEESAEKELSPETQYAQSSKELYEIAAQRYQIERNLLKSEKQLEEIKTYGTLQTAMGEISQAKKLVDLTDRMTDLSEAAVLSYQKDLKLLRQLIAADTAQLHTQDLLEELLFLQKGLALATVNQDLSRSEGKKEKDDLSRIKTKLIQQLSIIGFILFLIIAVRLLVNRKVEEAERRYYVNRISIILAIFIIIIGLLIILVRDFSNLVTGMGIAFAGLLITLQEIISSFSAWFIIRSGKGYRTGDWIAIGPNQGEVVDIGLFTTSLSQVTPFSADHKTGGAFTGGLTILANNLILKSSVTNYTRGYPYIWCRMTFTFTYESNWKKAEELIKEAVNIEEINTTSKQAREYVEKMASEFMIRMENTQPRIRVTAADSGIAATLLFLAHPRRRQDLVGRIQREMLKMVEEETSVDFAYNTLRIIPDPCSRAPFEENELEQSSKAQETED